MPRPPLTSEDQDGAGYAGTHAFLALVVVVLFIATCALLVEVLSI